LLGLSSASLITVHSSGDTAAFRVCLMAKKEVYSKQCKERRNLAP